MIVEILLRRNNRLIDVRLVLISYRLVWTWLLVSLTGILYGVCDRLLILTFDPRMALDHDGIKLTLPANIIERHAMGNYVSSCLR